MTTTQNDVVLEHDDLSYNGNPLLKPAFAKQAFTLEQLEEAMLCADDPLYFIRNYVKITNLDDGLVPFKPWPFQERMVETCCKERFVICKMPRQVGKTTTTAAIILWHALFNKQYFIAVLANKMDQAQEIMERIQLAYENLPKWLQQGVIVWNKRRIHLENGSKIIAAATSSSAIRGKSINLVYLDELAHVDRNLQNKFFTSTYPVISSGKKTKIIITSTPNGFDLFQSIWRNAQDDAPPELKNSYIPISVHWSDIPGRDEAWRERTIKDTSKEQFRQEFDCVSGSTLVTLKDKESGLVFTCSMMELEFLLSANSQELNTKVKEFSERKLLDDGVHLQTGGP